MQANLLNLTIHRVDVDVAVTTPSMTPNVTRKPKTRPSTSQTKRTVFFEAPMFNVRYINAASLHNKMDKLRAKATDSALDVLGMSEANVG